MVELNIIVYILSIAIGYAMWTWYNWYLQSLLKWDPQLFQILHKLSRIRLIGCAASGKSTLPRALYSKIHALKRKFHYIALDDLNHRPNSGFRLLRGEQYKESMQRELEVADSRFKGKWIMDGNTVITKQLKTQIWNDTDVVIVFRYSFLTVFMRGLIRSLKRVIFRRKCCNGNQETLRRIMFGKPRHSVPKLIWHSHKKWTHKVEKIKNETLDGNDKITWITFRHPNECEYWLRNTFHFMSSGREWTT